MGRMTGLNFKNPPEIIKIITTIIIIVIIIIIIIIRQKIKIYIFCYKCI